MKHELLRTLSQEKQVLADLLHEQTVLQRESATLAHRLQVIATRLQELGSAYKRCGEIEQARRKIASLTLRLADCEARRVVWQTSPYFYRGEEFVVHKVTQKRIYIRPAGNPREMYYNKDGTRGNTDGVIDVAATFPEGLENFKCNG